MVPSDGDKLFSLTFPRQQTSHVRMDKKWQNLKAPLNKLIIKTLKQLQFKYMTPVQVFNFLSCEKELRLDCFNGNVQLSPTKCFTESIVLMIVDIVTE